MMWARSSYYGLNSRMTMLFRMVNNMMIESASKFLDPGSLFLGEPDESLRTLNKVINALESHKACFKEYRENLEKFKVAGKDPIMWTFRPKDVFERFDLFLDRLFVVREIFDTASEFFKLEKIELGGLKGRGMSRNIQDGMKEFKDLYFKWTQIQFDPLDPTPKINHFERERRVFQAKAEDLERKLAATMVQAFDECYTTESLIKLIEVSGSLLHRKTIYHEIKDKLFDMLNHYDQDLDLVKAIFDAGVETISAQGIESLTVDRGFPPVSGTITWIKRMRTRIVKPIEELPNIEFKEIFESEDGMYTISRSNQICAMFDALEKEVFEKWQRKVPDEINANMKKFLLKSVDDGLLELNFDPALVCALKEVKMLRAMEKQDIPDVAIELFEISNDLWVSCVTEI